jgi:SET domain-containing protein
VIEATAGAPHGASRSQFAVSSMKSASAKTLRIERACSQYCLQIGLSAIDRRGVFALDPIPRNRKVIEYAGDRLTWQQTTRLLKRLWRLRAPPNLYLARFNRRWVINGAAGGNGSQFINHSCEPNLGRRRVRERLVFFSIRNIRVGDELTLDYQFPKYAPKTVCHCGSSKCRGTINLK